MGFNDNSVKVEKKSKVVYVKKGRLGFFFLGMLVGIIVFVGTLAGVGFWAYKNVNLNTFGIGIPDVDETAEHNINELTIEKMISEYNRLVSKKDTYTIQEFKTEFGLDLTKYIPFPVADKFLNYPVFSIFGEGGFDKLLQETTLGDFALESLKNNFDEPTYNQIASVSLSKIVNFDITEVFSGVKIGGLMKLTYNDVTGKYEDSDAIKQAFGNTLLTDLIGDKPIDAGEILNGVEFAALLGYKKNESGEWIKDGKPISGAVKAIADKQINDIMDDPDNLLDDVILGEVITIDASSPAILVALQNTAIGKLSEKINDITLGEAMTIDDKSSAILKYLKDTKINEMSASVDRMQFKDVIPTTSNTGLIFALQNSSVNSMETDVNKIYLGYAMNYYYGNFDGTDLETLDPATDTNGKWYELKNGKYVESHALNAKLASKKISEFGTILEELTLGDTGMNVETGAFALIKKPAKKTDKTWTENLSDEAWTILSREEYVKLIPVTDLSNEINAAVDKATMGELMANSLLTLGDNEAKLTAKFGDTWKDGTINDLLTLLINLLP